VDGTILADRYLLTEEIGTGGIGTVYKATDLRTGGPVAVKAPHPFLARDPAFRERLRREARLAAALTSPRVVRVVDLDEHEGVPYLVLEFVAGETLAERVRRGGALPVAEAVAIAREIARALEAAHSLGIVHRDLTPRNVKLVDGQVKVLDFGLAQAAGMAEFTPPGGFTGTPAYSAPERLAGTSADDPRSDLYSVGAILATLLTGKPLPASWTGAAAGAGEPTGAHPAVPAGLPPEVERVLARCLAPEPAGRYGSAAELAAALGAALGAAAPPPPPAATPRGTPVTGAAPDHTRPLPDAAASGTTTSATAGAPVVPHNLPASLTTFVGREVEVGELVRLLRGPAEDAPATAAGGVTGTARARLVTVVGPGGAGKTRLALQVAARLAGSGSEGQFPDGAWLVSLASLADGRLVAQAVAGALGVPLVPGRTALDAVTGWLQSRRLLLVLDNCEHLVAASAAFAQAALLASPGVRILATSQEPLGVPGEVLWRLPMLPAPDLQALPAPERLTDYAAVRLFAERARAVHPGFVLTPENAPAVARIAQRLDGMPLAIELAAARARVLAVEQIAARLDDRFRLLTAGSRTAPPQQQTLRASMDWSHELLSGPERVLFRRLAVFAGGFTLEAAEQVGAGPVAPAAGGAAGDEAEVLPEDVLDLLSQLVDKSLVLADEDAAAAAADGAETRYRLLETVREYAAERLAAAAEATSVARAHVAAYRALVDSAAAALNGPQQGVWLDRLQREHDNIRAALRASLDGADLPSALRIASGLWKFWAVRGHYAEGRRWLDEALAAASTAPNGEPEWRAILARANSAAGNLARARRDYAVAREHHQRALALWRERDDPAGVAAALANLGNLASDQGDPDAARPLFEESLELRRRLGDVAGIALLQNSLGSLAYNRRDFPAARAAYAESLARHVELGDGGSIALLHVSLGQVARATGDAEEAVVHGREGEARFRALGHRWGTSLALGLLGRLALDAGDAAGSDGYLEECVAILRALDDRWNLAVALLSQARAAHRRGHRARAAALSREGLQLALAGRLLRHVASGVEAVAAMLVEDAPPGDVDRLQRGAALLGAAAVLRQRAGSAVLPADQATYDATVATYRQRLGDDRFESALAAGRDLTVEGAVAAADSLLDAD
jgi:non-specific serine/threonine protein kinase